MLTLMSKPVTDDITNAVLSVMGGVEVRNLKVGELLSSHACWNGITLDLGGTISDRIITEVIWDLTELNL